MKKSRNPKCSCHRCGAKTSSNMRYCADCWRALKRGDYAPATARYDNASHGRELRRQCGSLQS